MKSSNRYLHEPELLPGLEWYDPMSLPPLPPFLVARYRQFSVNIPGYPEIPCNRRCSGDANPPLTSRRPLHLKDAHEQQEPNVIKVKRERSNRNPIALFFNYLKHFFRPPKDEDMSISNFNEGESLLSALMSSPEYSSQFQ